jgi:colicin import membrane protein
MKELEEERTKANGRATMVLYFDQDSDFSRGALQGALNSNAAAQLAQKNFRLLKISIRELRAAGLDKKLGIKESQIVFSTPGGKVVARFGESSMSAQAFVGYLEDVVAQTKKATTAEIAAQEKLAKAEAAKVAKAEKSAAEKELAAKKEPAAKKEAVTKKEPATKPELTATKE